jgi:hypothetical protein
MTYLARFKFVSHDKPKRNYHEKISYSDTKNEAIDKMFEYIVKNHEKEYPKISDEHIIELREYLYKHFNEDTMLYIDESGFEDNFDKEKEHLKEYLLTRYFLSINTTYYFIEESSENYYSDSYYTDSSDNNDEY